MLDLGLPDMDGLEVIRRVREWSRLPIIVLSARGQEREKVTALDAGADDYLTKPFSVGELLARIRVALRHRCHRPQRRRSSVPSRQTEGRSRSAASHRRRPPGPPHANRVSAADRLVQHAGRVITHRQLLKEVWGPDSVQENHYLRVFMAQLRQKLEADPARPRYLLTEPGVGYRLAAE